VFERTASSTITKQVDRQTPIGSLLTAGLEFFQTPVKLLIELKYDAFRLKETFEGSDDRGTGGGASLSLGVIF
jgi:hypothetical protein